MELGWVYIPFPSLSTTALFFIFHRIYLPKEFFFPHWNEVFILWWRSSLPWQDSRNTWGFQKYLNISYFLGVRLQKDCEDQEFPPAFTPSNPTIHFLAGNQAPAEWWVVLLASCCFLESFPVTCSSDEWRSNFEFHSRFIQGNNFLCVSYDKETVTL